MSNCTNTFNKTIDIHNFKGIYYGDEPEEKTKDLATGAHFKYWDMFNRLQTIAEFRKSEERTERNFFLTEGSKSKRNKSNDNDTKYPWVKKVTYLSKTDNKNDNMPKNQNNLRSRKRNLEDIMETLSKKNEIRRNLTKQFQTFKKTQSMGNKDDSLVLKRIVATLERCKGKTIKLKHNLKGSKLPLDPKIETRRQLRREIINQMHRRASSTNNDYNFSDWKQRRVHFRNLPWKSFKDTQAYENINKSWEFLSNQKYLNGGSNIFSKFSSKNTLASNQDGFLSIIDNNQINLEKKSNWGIKSLLSYTSQK